MLFGDAETLPYRAVPVDGVFEESVEAGAEADGVGHEGSAVEGRGPVEGGAGLPGRGVRDQQGRGVVEEDVFPLLYVAFVLEHIRQPLFDLFDHFFGQAEGEEPSLYGVHEVAEELFVEGHGHALEVGYFFPSHHGHVLHVL